MKRTPTESLQAELSNNMQNCILRDKMATCSRTLNFADILPLLDQQKKLEDAFTTDLNADLDLLEGDCDGTQALVER